MHYGFQFMEPIRTFAENVQQQIDFAGRLYLHRESPVLTSKKNAPTKMLAREICRRRFIVRPKR
jgi:hypothetical protein